MSYRKDQVIGCNAAITIGCQDGYFELSTMLSLIAYNLLRAIGLLATTGILEFSDRGEILGHHHPCS
jgi:fumarate hydratase class II